MYISSLLPLLSGVINVCVYPCIPTCRLPHHLLIPHPPLVYMLSSLFLYIPTLFASCCAVLINTSRLPLVARTQTKEGGTWNYLRLCLHVILMGGRLKWLYAITGLTAHFTCGLMSGLVNCKHRKECGHTWHWMSLLRPDFVNQHKLKLKLQSMLRRVWNNYEVV